LKAGSVVPIGILADAPAVRRGDPVTVEVQSGLARLRFEAVAESSARDGDMVELRNPFNGKTFRVRLDPGAKALIVVASGQRL
jgi:flagella basal body P-ring formation protein FlgA